MPSPSLLSYGLGCRGSTAGAVTLLLSSTTFGGSAIDATTTLMVVGCGGARGTGSGLPSDITSIEWGDGTNWQTMTREAVSNSADEIQTIYTLANPNVSYDRWRITTAVTENEGLGLSFACFKGAGALTIIDAQSNSDGAASNVTVSTTLTGGAAGDTIYIFGFSFTLPDIMDITVDGQTQLDTTQTSCGSGIYGPDYQWAHAYKDWSAGATCGVYGDYPSVAAIAIHDPGTGNITYTPTPASAVAANVGPTAIRGNLTQTPAPTSLVAANVDPTAIRGTMTQTPAPVSMVGLIVDPAIVRGNYTYTPGQASLVGVTIAPTAIRGSYTYTPSQASLVGITFDPTANIANAIAPTYEVISLTISDKAGLSAKLKDTGILSTPLSGITGAKK